MLSYSRLPDWGFCPILPDHLGFPANKSPDTFTTFNAQRLWIGSDFRGQHEPPSTVGRLMKDFSEGF